jgi:hypothetical protein
MRIRVSDTELEYYAKAKRDGQPVRYQGASWRVLGVTTDTSAGSVGAGRKISTGQGQLWWVELIEV